MRSIDTSRLYNSPKAVVWVILLLSLALRIAFVMTMDRDAFYFIDTSEYDHAATNLLKEGRYGGEYERPPVYPVFLAAVYLVSYQNFMLVRLVQCGLGALICVLIVGVGTRLYGGQTGFYAGLIAAIYPMFIFISGLLYPTTLITLWLLLVVFFLLRGTDDNPLANFSLAGLFMGLAILTKPVAIGLLILLISYFLFKKEPAGSKRLSAISLFVCCATLVTATWVVRNYVVRGELSVIESNKRILDVLEVQDIDQEGQALSTKTRFIRLISERSDEFLGRFARELRNFWALYPDRLNTADPVKRDSYKRRDDRLQTNNPYLGNLKKYVSIVSFSPILLFGFVGFLLSLQKRKKVFLLVSPILSFWVGYSFFYAKTRYRIPVEPFLIILSAWGVTTLVRWFTEKLKPSFGKKRIKAGLARKVNEL